MTLLAGVVLILISGGVSGRFQAAVVRKPPSQSAACVSRQVPAIGAGEYAGDVWWIFICLGLTVASWLWASWQPLLKRSRTGCMRCICRLRSRCGKLKRHPSSSTHTSTLDERAKNQSAAWCLAEVCVEALPRGRLRWRGICAVHVVTPLQTLSYLVLQPLSYHVVAAVAR